MALGKAHYKFQHNLDLNSTQKLMCGAYCQKLMVVAATL